MLLPGFCTFISVFRQVYKLTQGNILLRSSSTVSLREQLEGEIWANNGGSRSYESSFNKQEVAYKLSKLANLCELWSNK